MCPSTDDGLVIEETDLRLWRRIAATVTPLRPCRPSPAAVHPNEPDVYVSEPALAESRKLPSRTKSPPPLPARVPDLAHGIAPGLDKRSLMRLRKGQVRIEARIDLHGASQVEASHRLGVFLSAAQAAGRRCVLVITGKGSRGEGVLRQEVPRWLNEPQNRARVIGFCHATPPDGGEGALYVLLRRSRS